MFKKTFSRINFDKESSFRLAKSFELHKEALEADNLENQYIDLFTAIEVLIPKDPDSNKDRILQIHDTLVPYLSVNYYRKIIATTLKDLFAWNKAFTRSILSQVNEGRNNVEKLAALMVLKKYDSDGKKSLPLDVLYEKLNNERYFLMLRRMNKLHSVLCNYKEIQTFLEVHEKRIKWHIDRIYRTRNMIVHAGLSPEYIGTLIENLHSYYDILVSQLIDDNILQGIQKIQSSYTMCHLKVQSYRDHLQKRLSASVDETNILNAIFNE